MAAARNERLVLASRSPQRRAILEQLGIRFEVRAADVAEEVAGVPEAVASENALRKALAVDAAPGEVVLGVDTLVAIDLEIWGKPAGLDAARATLRRLSGQTHRVISGVALVRSGELQAATAITDVTFRVLDEPTIAWYLQADEWQDKAGGYAIQGRAGALVAAIHGDYLNVVGLPLATLLELWPGLLDLAR
jgi:septum formation protein